MSAHFAIAPPTDLLVIQPAASDLQMSAHFAIALPTGLIVIQSAASDLLMSAHFTIAPPTDPIVIQSAARDLLSAHFAHCPADFAHNTLKAEEGHLSGSLFA